MQTMYCLKINEMVLCAGLLLKVAHYVIRIVLLSLTLRKSRHFNFLISADSLVVELSQIILYLP